MGRKESNQTVKSNKKSMFSVRWIITGSHCIGIVDFNSAKKIVNPQVASHFIPRHPELV